MSLHRAPLAVSGLAAAALLALTPSAALARAADGTISTVLVVPAPTDAAYLPDGTLLAADPAQHEVVFRRPNGQTGVAAGDGGNAGDCGDTSSNDSLGAPRAIATDASGTLVIADRSTNCVRVVTSSGGFQRLAGAADGQPGLSGDGGPARSARLRSPGDIALGPGGSIYIADTGNDLIRRVGANGVITTAVGPEAHLDGPRDISVASDGTMLVADTGNSRVLRVTPSGSVTTVAGGNGVGAVGDGDPARTAQLDHPTAVLPLTHGGFLVADTANHRVRRVTPLGAIFSVAGSAPGGNGDGGLAKDAQLTAPEGLAARPGGGFTIADTGNNRVREVTDVGAVPGAQLGRSFNVAPVADGVTVTPAGTSRTLALQEEDLVPLGSAVDARTGQLTVTVRRPSGILDPALTYAGSFVPTQRPARDITDLDLTDPLTCPSRRSAKRAVATIARKRAHRKKRRKGKTRRQLWVKAQGGRYNVRGRHVGALERGTEWHVEESCRSATITVIEGSVRVRDRRTGRRHVVQAGESYTVFA